MREKLYAIFNSSKSGNLKLLLIIYLTVISIISIIAMVYDKKIAIANRGRKNQKTRISERALITLSILGGSLTMFIAMYIISHKTKKIKFFLGIPTIILFQTILALLFIINR